MYFKLFGSEFDNFYQNGNEFDICHFFDTNDDETVC